MLATFAPVLLGTHYCISTVGHSELEHFGPCVAHGLACSICFCHYVRWKSGVASLVKYLIGEGAVVWPVAAKDGAQVCGIGSKHAQNGLQYSLAATVIRRGEHIYVPW